MWPPEVGPAVVGVPGRAWSALWALRPRACAQQCVCVCVCVCVCSRDAWSTRGHSKSDGEDGRAAAGNSAAASPLSTTVAGECDLISDSAPDTAPPPTGCACRCNRGGGRSPPLCPGSYASECSGVNSSGVNGSPCEGSEGAHDGAWRAGCSRAPRGCPSWRGCPGGGAL